MPPPLTDDQISAALDDQAEPEVLAHLGGCAHCAARLHDARALERRLHARLYRWDCPTPDQLFVYQRGQLPPGQAGALAAHLRGCARCAGELADLRAFLLADAPPPAYPPPPPAARHPTSPRQVARMLPRQPAAALRGAGDGPIMAESGATTIFLDIQPAAAGQVAIQGQLLADDQASWEGALVELRQAGVLAATAVVDDLGSFGCPALPAGLADLRITNAAGQMIVLADIDARG